MEILFSVASFLATFFLGFFAEKLLDKLIGKISQLRKKRANKRAKEKMKAQEIHAIFTEDIFPPISSDNIWIQEEDASFFLAFPDELKDEVKKHLRAEDAPFAEKDHCFCDLTLPGFSDESIRSAIETARLEVAQKFVKREDGLYFNGEKYGVCRLDAKGRSATIDETPQLIADLYHTDYFTHRVVLRAAELLNIPTENLTGDSLNTSYRWLRTSLGVSVVVVLKSTNQIVMTRRSKNASFSDGNEWIYVSVTEALSHSDFDAYDKKVSLSLCVERGLKEELGIDTSMYCYNNIRFYDCFFETDFFQDGIVSSVTLYDKILPAQVQSLRAKDKRLEISEIFFIDNNKAAIRKFITENRAEMRSQTIFALESYAASL